MSDTRIFFVPGKKLYLKLPECSDKNEIIVNLAIPKELGGKYLKIEAMSENSADIPVKRRCCEEDCEKCGVVYCIVKYGNAELRNCFSEEKMADGRPIIPGHPNCHYGDCYDCHVVSCSIQQGWADIPEQP
ncbi:MAG: hypothetical protein IJ220_09165 [Clostridia bacterium]|nr:hypothetical protein [Clostridia bacterium]